MFNCARYDAICVHYTYIIDFLQLDIHMNPRQYKPIYHKTASSERRISKTKNRRITRKIWRQPVKTDISGHSYSVVTLSGSVALAITFRFDYAIFDYGKRQYSILPIFPAPQWTALNQSRPPFVVFHGRHRVCPILSRSAIHSFYRLQMSCILLTLEFSMPPFL